MRLCHLTFSGHGIEVSNLKRFTETDKWRDPWFRELSGSAKLLWEYLRDNCDKIGLVQVNFRLVSSDCGQKVAEEHMAELGERVQHFGNGRYFIPEFIHFQYGELSPACYPHKSIIQMVEERALRKEGTKYFHPETTTLPTTLPTTHKTRQDKNVQERNGEDGGVGEGTYSANSRAVLHILNELTGKKFREMESSLGPIHARMREEDVTLEGVTLMINRQCKLWKGTKFEEYLRPSTLFGKEKFNEYYAAREQPINRADSVRSNPRNEGVIVGVTDYATAKPRAQREREEAEAAMVGKVAPDAPHPSPSRDSLQSGLQSLLAIRQDAINR